MSRKRDRNDDEITSLKAALILVEKEKTFQTLQGAKEIWCQVSEFPPAQALLASQVSTKFFKENKSLQVQEMIEQNYEIWEKIEIMRKQPCCRGPACGKHMKSSQIVSLLQPYLDAGTSLRGKKLSSYAPFIEIMLQFTHVDLDGDEESWDRVEMWIEKVVSRHHLLAAILDPCFLIIRGPNGRPPPAGIIALLGQIPVGVVGGGVSALLTAASTAVTRPGAVGYTAVPDIYQFPNLDDAKVARAVVVAHYGAGNVDVIRFNVNAPEDPKVIGAYYSPAA